MKKTTAPLAEAASAYLGYTARGNNNTFSIDSGYQGGFQWDGAFIDRCVKDAGLDVNGELPKHVNTTTALAFYLRNGWARSTPKPGDLVFYSFSVSSGTVSFDQAHVGVVTNTDRYKKDGVFRAIEGQVSSGQPRAATDENGVYERTRYATDVLTFVRIGTNGMKTRRLAANLSEKESLVTVKPAYLNRCTSVQQAASAKLEHRKAVEAVQLALAAHPGVRLRNADRGVFNTKTKAALACYQRIQGYPPEDCNGEPTVQTLTALSKNSRFFRAEG